MVLHFVVQCLHLIDINWPCKLINRIRVWTLKSHITYLINLLDTKKTCLLLLLLSQVILTIMAVQLLSQQQFIWQLLTNTAIINIYYHNIRIFIFFFTLQQSLQDKEWIEIQGRYIRPLPPALISLSSSRRSLGIPIQRSRPRGRLTRDSAVV